MARASVDKPPPGEGPGRRPRPPRRFGARFDVEGRLDGGDRALWHVRVYAIGGRWLISARKHCKHRVWVISAEKGFTAVVRAAIRDELAARTGSVPREEEAAS